MQGIGRADEIDIGCCTLQQAIPIQYNGRILMHAYVFVVLGGNQKMLNHTIIFYKIIHIKKGTYI